MEQVLTIGMAHHNDYNGVYFSIQDIRKELIFNRRFDLLKKIEFLVIENDPGSEHARMVRQLEKTIPMKVVDFTEVSGTSATRNKIIEEARGNFVLVMDCHVLLCPVIDTLDRLFSFMEYNQKTDDLFCGPLIHDDLNNMSTHFNDSWGGQMWGQWGKAWNCVCEAEKFAVQNENDKASFYTLNTQQKIDKCVYCNREFPKNIDYYGHDKVLNDLGYTPAGKLNSEEPFEVFAQGLGCFFTRKNSWLKFNEHSRGFGGEECYIHTKYRKAGRKTINLPFLRWLHRFNRPDGVKYELTLGNKVRNYILEFMELGMDLAPVIKHFVEDNNFVEEEFEAIRQECLEIYSPQEENYSDVSEEIELLKSRLKNLVRKQKINA
tara:strand:+ start:1279 stop:2409 length:1131 start_codon:yes stop_codon:yes gene_type:complete